MEELKEENLPLMSVTRGFGSISNCLRTVKHFFTNAVGLLSLKMILVLIVWYAFSFAAIFLNKYILDVVHVDLTIFSAVQLLVSAIFGIVNIKFPCFMYHSPVATNKKESNTKSTGFYKVMFFVGGARFLVVYLGLVSLKYVAVSFTETIKSSAPLFTVIISRIMLKEKNGVFVQLSLIPIMLGLVLCSAYELSFTWIGFYAAFGTNIAECLQFVASKLSLSHEQYKLTPAEFQVYTCSTALAADVLLSLFLPHSSMVITRPVWFLMLLNGVLYHFQTMMAWVLMEFLSPVTHSVCNTVKCALAVWISVPLFGNHVTLFSGIGTCIVISGVFLYHKARTFEHELSLAIVISNRDEILSNHTPTEADELTDVPVAVNLDDSNVNSIAITYSGLKTSLESPRE